MSNENKQPDERAAFEAWAIEEGLDVLPCPNWANRTFYSLTTEDSWRGWQARVATPQANKGDEHLVCNCGVQCQDYGNEICRYHRDDAALGRLYREYFDQIHPEEVCKVVNARTTSQAVTLSDEPTEAMLNAARDWSLAKYGQGIGNDAAIGCWKAMFAARKGDSQ